MVEGYDDSQAGSFQLQLTCETLGINENSLVDIALYPNPVTDILNISSKTEITSVEIYNVNGQLLKNISLKAMQGEIDLNSLTTGIYFAKVIANNAMETFKIIKN